MSIIPTNKHEQPRILIIGAGVIGSLYGYKLAVAGNDITFLAKGDRINHLRLNGLNLQRKNKGNKTESLPNVKVIDHLVPNDIYDYIFIALRCDNLPSIYSALASNLSPCFVFMANNPYGSEEYKKHLPLNKVIIAFPGTTGDIKDGIVHYTIVNSLLQPTTIGGATNNQKEKVKSIATILKKAGFPTSICKNMDAWLLTHAAMICPLTNAIYFVQGTCTKAAKSKLTMLYTAQALKEAFRFLQKSKQYQVVPSKLKIFVFTPTYILQFILSIAYRTRMVRNMMPDYTSHSQIEMQLLSNEFVSIAEKEGFSMKKYRLISHEYLNQ